MKKSFLIFSVLAAVVLTMSLSSCSSCSGNKAEESEGEEKQLMELSKYDTTAVMSLVERYFTCLRTNHVDEAVDMLYYLDEQGNIIPLPDDLKRGQRRMLQLHAGLKYSIDYIKFWQETDSEVKFTCTLFDKEPGDTRPNEVKFLIRPMRHDGEWYLTMADTPSQTQESDLFKPKYGYNKK
jgi:hypothetical protein